VNYCPPKKRQYKYLYRKALDYSVIKQAYKNLRIGKSRRIEVIMVDANYDFYAQKIHDMILNTKPIPVKNPELAFMPEKLQPTKIFEHGKWRTIYEPPFLEQWIHHIIVLIIKPIFYEYSYQYSCGSIPNRGMHYGMRYIKKALTDEKATRNFAQMDVRHFFNSCRRKDILNMLHRFIKDDWFLYLVYKCLYWFPNQLPLGMYISQWFANLYLWKIDHLIVNKLKAPYYVRYLDDMILFAPSKKELQKDIIEIKKSLGRQHLRLKRNYYVSPFWYVKKNGKIRGKKLDTMGFVFTREAVTMRKCIMIKTAQQARRLNKKRIQGKPLTWYDGVSFLSRVGWMTNTNTYGWYLQHIKPYDLIKRLKRLVSKHDRKEIDKHDSMEDRAVRKRAAAFRASFGLKLDPA